LGGPARASDSLIFCLEVDRFVIRVHGVQSRHLVDRVKVESIRLWYLDFAAVFVGCVAAARLQAAGDVFVG
jgi:hypothetical protein